MQYFKKVISDLDIRLPNDIIRKKVIDSGAVKDGSIKIESTQPAQPIIPNYTLFFENDIPLPSTSYKGSHKFEVKPYDEYFQIYSDLAKGQNLDKNSEYQENAISNSTIAYVGQPEWIRYDKTIGIKIGINRPTLGCKIVKIKEIINKIGTTSVK